MPPSLVPYLSLQQVPGDGEALGFRGTLVDLGDLGVSVVALYGVFLGEPVPAVDLYGFPGHGHGHILGEELGHGRELIVRFAFLFQPGSL